LTSFLYLVYIAITIPKLFLLKESASKVDAIMNKIKSSYCSCSVQEWVDEIKMELQKKVLKGRGGPPKCYGFILRQHTSDPLFDVQNSQ
jgi:hypothetical protein